MSIKYQLIIYWSEEDQSFIVEVPELPGCMADGENAKVVIEEWIETAHDLDRSVPEPKGDSCTPNYIRQQEHYLTSNT